MKKGDKRAQMKLSFGMIFSIILIIIFITFAIYGISKFLKLQKTIQTKKFADDLQVDIDRLWNSNSGSQLFEYSLPTNIESVCFNAGGFSENMELRKKNGFGGAYNLEHVDITGDFCIKTIEGKVSINLEKKYGESLVVVSK